VVEAMLTGHSNHLYAGHLGASLDSPGNLRCMFSELRSVPVRNRDAARMFLLNLQTWKENQFLRSSYSSDSILELEQAVQEIGNRESFDQDIVWDIRQAAWLKD
jgi:hypothetical protein